MRVLGIMSGTSLDGVDYAVCSIQSPEKIRCEEHWSVDFPKELRARLHRAAANESATYELGEVHHDLGRFYAAGAKGARVELTGLHGQTVFHSPGEATLQIGEAAYLAEELRVPVISNFRAADIAAGGQGAPLATIFHRHVFAKKGRHVAVNNLGGISNVTSLDWRKGTEPGILAFDTGPANILMDMAARHFSKGRKRFDENGTLASRGKVNQGLWLKLMKHRYFGQKPPKSTGRETFGETLFESVLKSKPGAEDLLATLADFTAFSIATSYESYLPPVDEVILCGGGALNPYLYARIATALRELKSDIAIHSSADFGWHPQVIEASAFALLAWLTWHRHPGNIPKTTGAAGPRILGQISIPPS